MRWIRDVLNSGVDPATVSPLELRRFRYVNVALILLSLVSAPYAPYYLWLGAPVVAGAIVFAVGTSLAMLLDLRRRKKPEAAGFVATAVVWVTLCVANLDAGGMLAVASPWWLVVPTFGTLINGARAGLFWCAMTMMAITGLAVTYANGALPPSHIPETYFVQACTAIAGSVMINSLISVAFVQQFERAQALMEESLERLREEVRFRTLAEEEATRASEARARFVAMMSHEIRTPLHGVQGMNQLLEGTDLDEDQQRMVSVALGATRSLRAVLDDVLDFSKLDAQRIVLEEVSFSVRDMVDDIADLFRGMAMEKGLPVRCDIAGNIPARVTGDPTRLRQVLANLVSNALKFTADGEIGIRVTRTHANTCFEVYDTGMGIASEALPTLFEPFTQAEQSTTRRFGGTGLGLSICRELVRLMGGDLEVVSVVGQGTSFHFVVGLPVAADEAMEPVVQEVRQGLRVLVADDNPTNQMVVRTLLQRDGHEVVIVDDGEDALQAVTTQRFDVVFLDLLMPRMGGLEAAACIRTLSGPQAGVPIVALTAGAGTENREACLAAGMDDVLLKPFVFDDFRAVLARCASQSPERELEPV